MQQSHEDASEHEGMRLERVTDCCYLSADCAAPAQQFQVQIGAA